MRIKHLFLILQHGRPQTFFQGTAKIFQEGARTYFLPKKQRKRYYFSQKSLKTFLFLAGQGDKSPPCLPCGRPCIADWKKIYFWSQFSTCEKIYFLHTCSLQISVVQQLQKNDHNVDIGATKQLSNNLTLTFLLGKNIRSWILR